MTPRTPEFVATGILNGVYKRRPRIVLPAQPLQQLLLGDALSPRIGDVIVRLLSKPAFTYLIGLYRGRVYKHHPSRGESDDASRLWRRLG